MTTSAAAPPPIQPEIPATTSMTRTRTAAGDSSVRDGEVARAQIAAMQAQAMAGVIDAMPTAPTAAERSRESEPPRRTERIPDSSKSDPTDRTTARARAAEAELRVETAAYEGVRQAIANSGSAADRSGERREAARAADTPANEPDDRRRRVVRADRERAAEAVALARIEQARAGLADAAEAASEAAVEDVRRANELAAVIAQENARAGSGRALDPAAAEAAIELARVVGAVSDGGADGRLTVKVGQRALVDRSGVHPLELREVPRASDAGNRSDATRLEVAWPNRRVAEGVGGALAGHISAVNTLVPQVAVVVEEIATVARAEAALADSTIASVVPAGSDAPEQAGAPDAAGAPAAPVTSAPPTASDLLDELGASLTAATAESSRRQDVASAVAAITSGPPAGFFAAVVASAGEAAPAGPVHTAQRASQQLVSDLQQLTAAAESTHNSALGLAENTPFVPVNVTSSDPGLVRVDTPWPSVGPLQAGASGEAGHSGAALFDPDAIAAPLQVQLSVVSVAHGDVVMSRGGVPADRDVSGGQPVTLVIGTSAPATAPGAEPGNPSVLGEVTVPAPATIVGVADAINAESGGAVGGVSAGVQQGPDGLTHLILESGDGAPWAAARRPDGTSRDILGGFSLLAPRTDSVAVATGAGIGWTGISEDRGLEGPLPGLGLTLLPGSEGQQVTLTVTPAVEEVTEAVGELADSVRSVLAAAGALEADTDTDTDTDSEINGSVLTGASIASPAAAGAPAAAGPPVPPGPPGTPGTPEEGIISATDGGPAGVAAGPGDAGPGDGVTDVTDVTEGVESSVGTQASQVSPAVPVSAAGSAAPLAGDPAIMDLAAAFAAAISGVAVTSGDAGRSTALAAGATSAPPGALAVPGLTVEATESGRRRMAFDREAFARALADEPSGTRSAVRAAAAEVAGVAREALDGRVGLLAVRLHTELAAARDVEVHSSAPEWDKEAREIEATRRADALSALLDRLDAESRWLGGQLA